MTIERRNVGKRLSDAVINRASGTVYLAGQVADEPAADITGQTQQVLAQIDDLLFEAGTDKIEDPVRDDLPAGHRRFRRDERGLGKVGRARPDARARDGAGRARRARIQDRDPGRRRDRDPGLSGSARPPRWQRPLTTSAEAVVAATSRRDVVPASSAAACRSPARRSTR